ncbi:MAG: hypothetical protein WAN35_08195 [Terracidiphilus sp.]
MLSFLPIRCKVGIFVFLAACAVLSLAPCAAARSSKEYTAATLRETADYNPCGEECSVVVGSTSAFCFQLDDQFLVGEGRSVLHGEKYSALDDLVGKQLTLGLNRRSLWVGTPDGPVIKLRRGSSYENFKDPGCIRAVHQPIIAAANAQKRPVMLPADAFPLASSGYIYRFLWYQCALDADKTEITCQSWYPNGDAHGKDFFCARTMAGEPVGAVATLDPLLSQTGRLVLKSGIVVRHDNRARTNDVLDRAGEACR